MPAAIAAWAGSIADGQRAGRAAVREAHHRAVHRHEHDVERPVTPRHPPPVAVEHRVAEVQDAEPVRLDEPRDLRVADAVGAGRAVSVNGPGRRPTPRARPAGAPGRRPPARARPGRAPAPRRVAATGRRLEHRRAGRERRGQCPGVGVVAVQVGHEPGHGPAGARPRRPRAAACPPPLAERRERPLPRPASGSTTTVAPSASSSDPGPAQPCQSHPSVLVVVRPSRRVIQNDRSFGICAAHAAPLRSRRRRQPRLRRRRPPSTSPRSRGSRASRSAGSPASSR